MMRSRVQRVEEESRKLNDWLTGFVEIKLAGGIKGDGGRGGEREKGDDEQQRATNRQTLYPQRTKRENEDVTRVPIPCPFSAAIM